MVKVIENPRVLVVEAKGKIEIYRPAGNQLEINYGEDCEANERVESTAIGNVVLLDDFSGELGIPPNTTFRIGKHREPDSVYGVVSGPGYIECDRDAEILYPEDLACVAFGSKEVHYRGQKYSQKMIDGDNVFESEYGLFDLIRTDIELPIREPEAVCLNSQMRMRGSLSNLPAWICQGLLIADTNKALIVNAERMISIGTYKVEQCGDGGERMSLHSYAIGCLDGFDLERVAQKYSPQKDEVEDSVSDNGSKSFWKRFLWKS